MCPKFIFLLLLVLSQTHASTKICENVNMENFNYSQLMGSWYKIIGVGDELSESCGLVEYSNFNNGVGFQINFDADGTNLLAMITPSGKTLVNINGVIYYHVVVTDESGNYNFICLCPVNNDNLSELVWILSRNPDWIETENETIQQIIERSQKCDYKSANSTSEPSTTTENLGSSTESSTNLSSPTTETTTVEEDSKPDSSTERITTPEPETTNEGITTLTPEPEITTERITSLTPEPEITTASLESTSTTETTRIEETTNPSESTTELITSDPPPETTKDPESTDPTSTPTETPPQESSQTPTFPDFPQGFKIPGSDKIFYFESQMRQFKR